MLSVMMVGDLYLDRPSPEFAFSGCEALLSLADFRFGNYEVALSDVGQETLGKVCLLSRPEMVRGLTEAGFDGVGLANNHTLDYGRPALEATLQLLEQKGIRTVGAGKDRSAAYLPVIFGAGHESVAILQVTSVLLPGWEATDQDSGLACVKVRTAYEPSPRLPEQPGSPSITRTSIDGDDLKELGDWVAWAKQRAEVVVVSWHWGVSEGFKEVVPYQVEASHAAVDFGADLIIGHHPHVVQGIEVYRGSPIFYSLGNFMFDFVHPAFGRESMVVELRLEGGKVAVGYHPVYIADDGRPFPVTAAADPNAVAEHIEALSSRFGTSLVVADGYIRVDAQ